MMQQAIQRLSKPVAPGAGGSIEAACPRGWARSLAAALVGIGVAALGVPAGAQPVTETFTFTKSFTDDPATAGGTVTLEFSIENPEDTPLTDIAFTDDLDAALSGLSATDLPQSNVCGAGSQLTGTSVLSMTGGILGPSASCTFSTILQIPAAAPPGTFVNTTSILTGSVEGLPVVADPATDTLTIEPPPTFAKSFAPDTIASGETSTLTFTIDNGAAVKVPHILDGETLAVR